METTKAHFEIFKAEANFWIRYFGLIDWDLSFEHSPDSDGAYGACFASYPQKTVIIRFSDAMEEDELTTDGIRQVAFHEVCELLLAEARYVINERYVQPEMVDHALHGIISRLTNTIYQEKGHGYSKT